MRKDEQKRDSGSSSYLANLLDYYHKVLVMFSIISKPVGLLE